MKKRVLCLLAILSALASLSCFADSVHIMELTLGEYETELVKSQRLESYILLSACAVTAALTIAFINWAGKIEEKFLEVIES